MATTMAMQNDFYDLKVAKVVADTPDSVLVEMEVPPALQPVFAYQSGQYLTFKKEINGVELRRSYSLCSAPQEGKWQVAIKRVDGGVFSNYAHQQLRVGEVLSCMPPNGRFVHHRAATAPGRYTAIASGSGITPVLSLLKSILHTEPESQCTLIYGNRTRSSIMLKEALEALKNKYMQRLKVIHILSREVTDATLNSGRIDADKCSTLFTSVTAPNADAYYLCGPEDMIFCVRDYLTNQGVPPARIHFELFGTGQQKRATQVAAGAEGPMARVQLRLDGRQFQFQMPQQGQPLLDAALANGADLPYACKGGVCCTCKALLLKGQVHMDVNYGLEPDELAAGYILTCQAQPLTSEIEVDFDV